jgi:hypothetical protein
MRCGLNGQRLQEIQGQWRNRECAHNQPNYYGAFVLDPDGHNIEAVCHDPPDRPGLKPGTHSEYYEWQIIRRRVTVAHSARDLQWMGHLSLHSIAFTSTMAHAAKVHRQRASTSHRHSNGGVFPLRQRALPDRR